MIDLSILVCSVLNRHDTFLPKILKELQDQYQKLTDDHQDRVEIIILTDNKKMMLGHKRNIMIDIAQGKYVQFIDDDDRIAPDFISALLEATASDCDIIAFQAEVALNGNPPKICYYSKDNRHDYNSKDAYFRIPNHISCIKKEISQKSSFPNVMYGEDAGYSKVLLRYLKTEHKIDRVLYYYDYNVNTSETQIHRKNPSVRKVSAPLVDVIILSKAMSRVERRMTQTAVDSCFNGANSLPINIMVLEQGRYTYHNATTIDKSQEKFNYNSFANSAAEQVTAEWIMIANNDLIFNDAWLHNLIAADHPIVSPHEPNDTRQSDITENTTGYQNGKHFSGWCFMIKRSLWKEIGGFDDCVDFWFSDDVVVEQLKAKNIQPMLVKDSIVQHLGSKTLKTVDQITYNHLTWRCADIFNAKYNQTKFVDNPQYIKWKNNNQ